MPPINFFSKLSNLLTFTVSTFFSWCWWATLHCWNPNYDVDTNLTFEKGKCGDVGGEGKPRDCKNKFLINDSWAADWPSSTSGIYTHHQNERKNTKKKIKEHTSLEWRKHTHIKWSNLKHKHRSSEWRNTKKDQGTHFPLQSAILSNCPTLLFLDILIHRPQNHRSQ